MQGIEFGVNLVELVKGYRQAGDIAG